MELIETVIDSQEIYSGKIVHLRVDTVRLPNGHESKREIVGHRGAVCIVPVKADGTILLVRQFRLAAGKVLLEIPAGTLEAGEDPADCAARELEEETGYAAATMVPLGRFYTSPGLSDELMWAYAASGLHSVGQKLEPDERVVVHPLEVTKALAMITSGELTDGKSIATVLLAKERGLLA